MMTIAVFIIKKNYSIGSFYSKEVFIQFESFNLKQLFSFKFRFYNVVQTQTLVLLSGVISTTYY